MELDINKRESFSLNAMDTCALIFWKVHNTLLKPNYINPKIAVYHNKLEENTKGSSPKSYFLGGKQKSGGKQWQTPPKNLPRMQRTRAIPVT
jgi:hypothetical protein